MRVRAMGPSVCANWTNCFLTRLQMKKLSSIFQWKQKKKKSQWMKKLQHQFQHQYSEWRLLQKHMAGANQPATHVHKGDQRKPTDWHCIACAQRRPAEANRPTMHVHRGGPQKSTDWHHMCTEEAHRSQPINHACAQRPSASCSVWHLKPKKALSAVAVPYPSVECPNYTSL